MTLKGYDNKYFLSLRQGTKESAKEIVPVVMHLIRPHSVIDVGCGTGIWLAEFSRHGVAEILGIDGDYVDRNMLEIPKHLFVPLDLTKPFRMERRFDLVVSLEVAEHLPAESSETFIDSLTRLGPAVLFSAAIPLQGGVGHLNEQWPEYWAQHFRRQRFVPIDCVRKKIWLNNKVDYWYSQNTIVYVASDRLAQYPVLNREDESSDGYVLPLVHPKRYLETVEPNDVSFVRIVKVRAEKLGRRIRRLLRAAWSRLRGF